MTQPPREATGVVQALVLDLLLQLDVPNPAAVSMEKAVELIRQGVAEGKLPSSTAEPLRGLGLSI